VPIVDAPPTGPVALCNEDTARESAKVEIETPGAVYTGRTVTPAEPIGFGVLTNAEMARELNKWLAEGLYRGSVPQPDGDCRFPNEAE